MTSEVTGHKAASVELKVRAIEERLQRLLVTDDSKFTSLKDQVQKFEETARAEKLASDLLSDRASKDIELVRGSLILDINSAAKARREVDTRTERQAGLKAAGLAEEIKRENKENANSGFARDVGSSISKLFSEMDQARTARIEKGEKLAGALHGEINKLAGAVDAEKRIRVQQQNQVLKMMEEMCMRISAEIEQERCERQDAEEHLLGLLEETCSRVEGNFQLNRR